MVATPLRRVGGLTLYEFDPAALALVADSRGGSSTVPKHAAEVLAAHPDLVAVLDGPMFGTCGPGGYDVLQCATLAYLHLDTAAGLRVAGSNADVGVTIAVTDGVARAFRGAVAPVGARVAVQMYPTLVVDGHAQATSHGGSNDSRVWRAALGIRADGRLVFAVAVATMADFAQQLAAAGVRDAGYTDGGGSTRLQVRGADSVGSAEDRRVASWLAVREPSRAGAAAWFVPIGLAAFVGIALASRSKRR